MMDKVTLTVRTNSDNRTYAAHEMDDWKPFWEYEVVVEPSWDGTYRLPLDTERAIIRHLTIQ